ncbi:calcium-independent phospholipase A2-gamma isoform X1 [Bufo gargarizans]|uniref:calcium-independent phospholipase A2-gamma isoform X1 n=1 Tax=Bufo gargarizans TaxID=30331 RepID=UPI001CF2CBCA|nr:calcium-independent phospholipase A2-gamma isoform X1 [Bufo gargarizans]XP_044136273.1 calcium-independent phospholipase A2-gamma isoform X1 [Bufo gargarizans]XP_044136274.1 calcium-independent phospholipase A2-gamma isoform X1 [Bufo gargarizans]
MSVLLLLDTYLYFLTSRRSIWRRLDLRPVYSCCRHYNIYSGIRSKSFDSSFQQPAHLHRKAGEREFIHTKAQDHSYSTRSKLSTTTSKGITIAKKSMSRIKSTLDSVTKAVSSTHGELLSRIVRPKPNPANTGKEENIQIREASAAQSNSGKGDVRDTSKEPLPTPSKKPDSTTESTSQLIQASTPQESSEPRTSLFHVSYITTNFGETYNFLAHHINSYFANETSMEKANGKGPSIDVSSDPDTDLTSETEDGASSAKKSISNFLSNQSSNVHAFVGNYLGGLVPKFKPEQKLALEEKTKELESDESESKTEQEISKDKGVDEKAKRLSLQREKIIARVSVDNRTRSLVQSLQRASDRRLCINRVEELSCHLLEFPETRGVAVKEKAIPYLLRLRQAHDETLRAAVREALSLIGYNDPVKGRGIRVLTIDGGGTRGVVALQMLRKLEELTGKPVHQLFDYICGVSTGAILAFMLGLFHLPLDECDEMYRKLGSDVFKQNVIVGTVKMGWSHAYYNSEMWEKLLKEKMGSDLLIETARNPLCPKVAAVSTIVNRGIPLKAFVFRNYNHFPGVKSPYMGGCQNNLWQAIRASSAAPGYFQEYVLGNDLHQDGGLLINNPCALAIHECKCLWPDATFQCIVSLGTGRYEGAIKTTATHTSLKAKLNNVISSATDTEEVHKTLDALLPPNTYFRFNPVMSEDIPLDENRTEKLSQLLLDGQNYLERNEEKLKKAATVLKQDRTTFQRICDWTKLKVDMYDGFPVSKL